MVTRPVRIAVSGTHSTGKTTFLQRLEMELRAIGQTVARTPASFAQQAAERGFPKLRQQTAECTEWIISASGAAAAEATLTAGIVLIDRSALDPLAYYLAAHDRALKKPDPATVERLGSLVRAHCASYDLLIATNLDFSLPLGDTRDRDLDYREAVDRRVHSLLADMRISHLEMGNHPDHQKRALAAALAAATAAGQDDKQ
ncbi:AAA family ATPase [Streptomyces sp. ISL-87]|uniref:AAA family ATPase n=1 Tax=Streptomyces sp. ISL-87 TaxID=2819188 RepID=UPI001BEC8DED|nr:AAA family ATPase [Streptomyces sp. ISL-87]MBT2613639.1 AAA family ATPase [Streptomyces sp. ISL-87]